MTDRIWFVAVFLFFMLSEQSRGDDFPEPFNTEKSTARLMTAEEVVAGMVLPAGFKMSVFAAEPDVHQPIALATDDRGRLWVAENYTYAESVTNYESRLRDRILIFEDNDNDGVFDTRKVFWDRGRRLTSVEVGYGGVWVLDAPNLLFIPDTDSDDVPDGDPVVMLDGWDDNAARHTIVNGLRWGPDGWLYGRNGIMAVSHVGQPGATPEQRISLDCGIWRFHPKHHAFEVVCVGTTNPWGMDWDENGQMFFINTVIGHLWHVIPGARFRRMYGEHLQAHTYGVIEQTADHFHWDTNELWHDIRKDGVTIMTATTDEAGGGHAHCGMTILQGAPYPRELQGSVLALNLHGRRINRDTLHRDGASYTARHAADFLQIKDPWFRGIEILGGRDGELYIADWSDTGECHENEGVHRTSGRIYRLALNSAIESFNTSLGGRQMNSLTNQELAEYVASDSEWLSRKCLLKLGERTSRTALDWSVREYLIAKLRSNEPERNRLRGLWALHITNGTSQDLLLECLNDQSEHVRSWAIQFLTERGNLTTEVLSKFQEMARKDDSGLVLTWLASSLQRLRYIDRWPIALALGSREDYSQDRVLPLMVWYGVEPAILSHPDHATQLVRLCKFPIVRQYIARRITMEIERQPQLTDKLVEQLVTVASVRGDAIGVLRGMSEALKGWRRAPRPTDWAALAASFDPSTTDPETLQLVRELSLVFGDGRAMEELRKIAKSGGSSVAERRAAIRTLVLARDTEMISVLQNLLTNRDMCLEAISGLAAYGDEETPMILIEKYQGFSLPAKQSAITTLVSRPKFAHALLDAVSSGMIDRTMVSSFQLRQMQNSGDETLRDRVLTLWPDFAVQSQEKVQQIAALQQSLNPEKLNNADPSHGRLLFQRRCATCHILYGEGEKIAPELTGAQRSNLNYLLENIVDPNATVSANYKLSIALLADGRVLNGIVSESTEKTLTLQTATEAVVIDRSEIESLTESPVSMMPENLLNGLDSKEIENLFAYLMTTSQVALPMIE